MPNHALSSNVDSSAAAASSSWLVEGRPPPWQRRAAGTTGMLELRSWRRRAGPLLPVEYASPGEVWRAVKQYRRSIGSVGQGRANTTSMASHGSSRYRRVRSCRRRDRRMSGTKLKISSNEGTPSAFHRGGWTDWTALSSASVQQKRFLAFREPEISLNRGSSRNILGEFTGPHLTRVERGLSLAGACIPRPVQLLSTQLAIRPVAASALLWLV